jgi:hypothetical protein
MKKSPPDRAPPFTGSQSSPRSHRRSQRNHPASRNGYLLPSTVGISSNTIVNLVDRVVEVRTKPTPAGYASCLAYISGQNVPVVIDGVEVGQINVADILPSRPAHGPADRQDVDPAGLLASLADLVVVGDGEQLVVVQRRVEPGHRALHVKLERRRLLVVADSGENGEDVRYCRAV